MLPLAYLKIRALFLQQTKQLFDNGKTTHIYEERIEQKQMPTRHRLFPCNYEGKSRKLYWFRNNLICLKPSWGNIKYRTTFHKHRSSRNEMNL